MKSALPPTTPPGADWAAAVINSPFVYLRCPLALNSAPASLPIITNIATAPAGFTVVDADASSDNNEGYWTPDSANDNDYLWPGAAGYDASTHALHALGNFLTPGTVQGVGGRILLIAGKLFLPVAGLPGVLMTFGTRNATAGSDAWSLAFGGAGSFNLSVQIDGADVAVDMTAASAIADDNDHSFAFLLDAKNGNLRASYDGVSVTPAGAAVLLSLMNAMSTARLPVSWTIGASNTATAPGTRTPATSAGARIRDLLIMDMTDYTGDYLTEFASAAAHLHRAPLYALPRYLERF